MDLISPKDLVNATPILRYLGGERIAKFVSRIFMLDRINQEYALHSHETPEQFIDSVIQIIGLRYELAPEDLENIPGEGSFITISNHAFGGIDGILLLKVLAAHRPDYRIIVNFLLTKLFPIRDFFLGVNPFEAHKDVKSSIGGLKDAFIHLSNGHPVGIFPAGEVSTYHFNKGTITDKEWQHSILKFIKKAEVPIVPIYFEGHNSIIFHLLGKIHTLLRLAKLPSEMFNKKGDVIRIRIGQVIPVKEQQLFRDTGEFGRYLRMRTYNLGIPFKQSQKSLSLSFKTPEKIIEPVSGEVINKEIAKIKNKYLLFNIKENYVFCAPSGEIPEIMREIGRLREITYREVGEGTHKSLDVDMYDPFFEQLFIWDDEEKQIIGGYRIGKGQKIMESHGMKGFYIHSLFKIDEKFTPVLKVSIELGRSFIKKNYQKKTLSLFLLWKGILYLLLKHPEYRYLVGPLSISNEFSDLSKNLVVDFLKTNYFNTEFAEFISPRKEFKEKKNPLIDRYIFHKYTEKDISRLDRFIQDFDPRFKIPVLLRKYISVNAEIIGFNIDPNFNNCVDALMILDLFEVPFDTIETLSKEINDQSILERFKK